MQTSPWEKVYLVISANRCAGFRYEVAPCRVYLDAFHAVEDGKILFGPGMDQKWFAFDDPIP